MTGKVVKKTAIKKKNTAKKYPIKHWSHSSLMAFLRNPLAWYKRYVEEIYDVPSSPSGIVGRAGHVALQHYYGGIDTEGAVALGLEYLRTVPDFEINFGKAKTRKDKKAKRRGMERDYLQAIGFYLERPPRHKVLAVELKSVAQVKGIALPLKAVSDLVVRSSIQKGALDIVDHKFVESFSATGAYKSLFMMQAIFNYYTVREKFGLPVRRFIIFEVKKSKNADGRAQLRRYVIDFARSQADFVVFHRLLKDATNEIARKHTYLPNPSDMFEGENSFDIYRLGLVEG